MMCNRSAARLGTARDHDLLTILWNLFRLTLRMFSSPWRHAFEPQARQGRRGFLFFLRRVSKQSVDSLGERLPHREEPEDGYGGDNEKFEDGLARARTAQKTRAGAGRPGGVASDLASGMCRSA